MTGVDSKVLIVHGNEQIAMLSTFLKEEVITPLVAHSGRAALEKIRTEHPDALVADMKLPDVDGIEIMKEAKAMDEDLPVILITSYPEIRYAVAAMRAGAHDCLAKPLKHHEVLRVIFRALNERALEPKPRRPSCQIRVESSLRESMGASNVARRLIADVSRVAKTNFSVLIPDRPEREKNWWRGPSMRTARAARLLLRL